MNKDTRLPDVVHVLLHLGQVSSPVTSDILSKTMGTNAAVFRRTMAGLREAGFVKSDKGHGGGWMLSVPLSKITLLNVYSALGRPGLFAIGNRNRPTNCFVETNVNNVLRDTLEQAEAMIVERFGEITLDQIAPDADAPISMHLDAREDAG